MERYPLICHNQLLAEGHFNNHNLYESVSVKIAKKNLGNKSIPPSATKLKLKEVLTNYSSRSFYCGEDILYYDLEKRNNAGPLLITGRNLPTMAIQGAREYKKKHLHFLPINGIVIQCKQKSWGILLMM